MSNACDSHVSSGFSAALMPPAAATECERTGWTLLMIATVAPASAAARAARWPARPAPMMRTSWAGIALDDIREGRAATRGLAAARRGRRQRPLDLIAREHAAQAAVGVDGHDRAEAPQRLGRDRRLERLVGADRLPGGPRGRRAARGPRAPAGRRPPPRRRRSRSAIPRKRPASSTTGYQGQPPSPPNHFSSASMSVVAAGIVSGSRSMMSATRMPSRRSVTRRA